VLELLVKDLVHFDWVGFELVDLEDSVRQGDGVLEPGRGQLFVLLHQRSDIVEVTVEEARHDVVFVLVYFVAVKVFILLDQLFQVLAHSVVCVD